MTRKVIGFVSLLTVLLTVSSFSQISSLQVNGSSTTFTMTSGDSVWWSYHVSPVGATAQVQIWYDVNANGTIEPGTDLLWQAFSQTDGDTSGGNGPPDYDRTANGVTTLNKIPIGLAPGKYVMLFSQGAANLTVTGTVNALASPAHTLSGTVTVPVGKSAANIFVGVESSAKKDNGPGWWALTNGSGNYQIAMGADTSGGPWRVHLGINPYPPGIVTPPYQFLYIVGNPSGLNISIVAAAAQIVGTVKDDLGAVIPGADVAASNMYVGQANSVQANASGFYQIGLTSAMLSGNTGFAVTAYFQQNQGMTTNRLDAMGVTGTISNGDSVVTNLIAYTANSTISGTVKVNGSNPGYPIQLSAMNADSGQSVTWTDPATGGFSFPVSNKIYNYTIVSIGGLSLQPTGQQIYHAGQTGITVNFSTTGVAASPAPQPREWSLGQNYPNPFNPSTEISYSVPVQAHVSLAVYNILGIKVADLVNANRNPGNYTVRVDGSTLSSGVYFYRLKAGDFVQTRKMVLLK